MTNGARKSGAQRIVRAAAWLLVLVPAGAALAADAGEPAMTLESTGLRIGRELVETVLFGLVGIFLSVASFRIFDKAVPWDLHKEIEADHNVAAAIVVASMFLGVAIIIAAVILS